MRGGAMEIGRGDMHGGAMEVEALRSLSWEGGSGDMQGGAMEVGRRDMHGGAMEVEAMRSPSWERGRRDMHGVCGVGAEGGDRSGSSVEI